MGDLVDLEGVLGDIGVGGRVDVTNERAGHANDRFCRRGVAVHAVASAPHKLASRGARALRLAACRCQMVNRSCSQHGRRLGHLKFCHSPN